MDSSLSFETNELEQKNLLKKVIPVINKVVHVVEKVNNVTSKIVTVASVL